MKMSGFGKRKLLVYINCGLGVLLAVLVALLVWMELGNVQSGNQPTEHDNTQQTDPAEPSSGAQSDPTAGDGQETTDATDAPNPTETGDSAPTEDNTEDTHPTDDTEPTETTEPTSGTEATQPATDPKPTVPPTEDPKPTVPPTEDPPVDDPHVPCVNGEIQTPYLTLYYPDALSDHLKIVNTNSKPYTLEFYVVLEDKPPQRIFDIYIGEGSDGSLGTLETASGKLPAGMKIYLFAPDDTWSQGEIDTVQAMQEGVNELLDKLPLTQASDPTQPPIIPVNPGESNLVTYMDIKTPFCTLQYPDKWKEYLQVEQEAGEVHKVLFYGRVEGRERQLLFAIYFGGDEGEQLGVVANDQDQIVPVNVLFEELSVENWSEVDAGILYSMQDAANQLIEKLPLL